MVQVSEDIFYQVKKEILDKLDVVLQKVNLEIIHFIHPHEDEFSFIELSSFEAELQNLFHYLDRLYASLNSSVSFSSINSYKSTAENYHLDNQRLTLQIQHLKKYIQQIGQDSNCHGNTKANQQSPKISKEMKIGHQNTKRTSSDIMKINDSNRMKIGYEKGMKISNETKGKCMKCQAQKEGLKSCCWTMQKKIEMLACEMSLFGKDIRSILKGYKFQNLEWRVEIISRLKQFQALRGKEKGGLMQCEGQDGEGGEQILRAINQLLLIC